jgi:O-antigen/teichoic acid export membrane protein
MILGFLIFWLLFAYSETVLELFYSKDFIVGSIVLKVLAAAQFINGCFGLTGQNLLAVGDSKSQFRIRLGGIILSTVLAVSFGIFWEIVGVAIAVLISLLTTNLMQIYILIKKHKIALYSIENFYVLILMSAYILLVSFLHTGMSDPISSFADLMYYVIESFIFIALLFIFRLINKRDFQIIKITNTISRQ